MIIGSFDYLFDTEQEVRKMSERRKGKWDEDGDQKSR